MTLNLDDPRMLAGFQKLTDIADRVAQAREQGGIMGGVKRAFHGLHAALVFGRLYILPAKYQALPKEVRLAPTW